MERKDITRCLTDILIANRFSDRKYYALEVTLDYGTNHTKRIDAVQFIPKGVIYGSDMEKGTFVCYEIKSCKNDVYSGSGLNFFGEKNYIVTTMETYKELLNDFNDGTFDKHLRLHFPESSRHYGVLVAVPSNIDLKDTGAIYKEFTEPTAFNGDSDSWKLYTAIPCREGPRTRSTVEMLFCMLRSKHNYTNIDD